MGGGGLNGGVVGLVVGLERAEGDSFIEYLAVGERFGFGEPWLWGREAKYQPWFAGTEDQGSRCVVLRGPKAAAVGCLRQYLIYSLATP